MPKRRPRTSQQILPGMPPAAVVRDDTPVTMPMREVHSGSDKAWFLAPASVGSGKAAWAPRSKVTKGEGPAASQFTMPRWVAVENGWLK